jgi:hypothetical protein
MFRDETDRQIVLVALQYLRADCDEDDASDLGFSSVENLEGAVGDVVEWIELNL